MSGLTNITLIDGLGNPQYALAAENTSGQIAPATTLVDAFGMPLAIGAAIGAGTDFSANSPSLYGLLLSSGVTTSGFYVQNQSAEIVQVVLDDGLGGVPTILLLNPGYGPNTQGGASDPMPFAGRVRVYCSAASGQVGARYW